MAGLDPSARAAEGQRLFQKKQFASAAGAFAEAAEAFAARGDEANAAEQRNNQSVALLMAGQAEAALRAAEGTEAVFAARNDRRREGLALANQAAALADLGRRAEALERYRRASALLAEAGEGDLRSVVEKAIAALQLKSGRLDDSAMSMLESLHAAQRPTLVQRILKFLLRLRPW